MKGKAKYITQAKNYRLKNRVSFLKQAPLMKLTEEIRMYGTIGHETSGMDEVTQPNRTVMSLMMNGLCWRQSPAIQKETEYRECWMKIITLNSNRIVVKHNSHKSSNPKVLNIAENWHIYATQLDHPGQSLGHLSFFSFTRHM